MRELSVVAEKLRFVHRARREFLELWSIEQGLIYPMLDRMVDEMDCAFDANESPGAASESAGAKDEPQRKDARGDAT